MNKPPPSSPLFDIYQWVWKTCLTLKPFFLIQFLVVLLQYAGLFLCMGLILSPFALHGLDRIREGISHFQDYDWTPLLNDWMSILSNPGWITLVCILVLVYTLWWCVLAAFSDGGVNRTFWAYYGEGKPFNWGSFYQEGLRYTVPMLWLQFYLSLWALGAFLAWFFLSCVVIGLLSMANFNTMLVVVVSILFGLPSLLFWIVFTLGFILLSFLSKAYLTQGMNATEAIRRAYSKLKADHRRVGLGLLVAFLTYIGVSMVAKTVLGILCQIPFLGILFSFLDAFLGIALTVVMVIYLSGLSVAYLQEEAKT